jgi:hypothetical protein
MGIRTTGITATGTTRNPNDEPGGARSASCEEQIRALPSILKDPIGTNFKLINHFEKVRLILK